ncbi:hypothetical protein ABZ333_30915, partial [Streptomyces olivaceus]
MALAAVLLAVGLLHPFSVSAPVSAAAGWSTAITYDLRATVPAPVPAPPPDPAGTPARTPAPSPAPETAPASAPDASLVPAPVQASASGPAPVPTPAPAAEAARRWTADVSALVDPASPAGRPVVALQDAGATPPPRPAGTPAEALSGAALAALPPAVGTPGPSGARNRPAPAWQVTHTQWRSRGGNPYDVYFLRPGAGGPAAGGGGNLAVAAPRAADAVTVVPGPGGTGPRAGFPAALGVLLDGTWYFCLDTRPGPGPAVAPGLLAGIDRFVAFRNENASLGEDAIALGGYDRAPDAWSGRELPGDARILRSGEATRRAPGGVLRELDYGIAFEPAGLGGGSGVLATALTWTAPDVRPVRIGTLAAPAVPPAAVVASAAANAATISE